MYAMAIPLFLRLLLFAMPVLYALFPAPAAAAQVAGYRQALKVISDKLHRQFPYLEGSVVAVKGGDLYLSLGAKDKVTKGLKVNVYRKGEPFRHPTTGVALGTLEDDIGLATVVEVREKFSVARMVRLTPGSDLVPKTKDIVRLSSAKLRIAVLPFLNRTKEPLSTDVLTRDLASILLSEGRFDVYDTDRLQVWLLETGVAVDEVTKGRNALLLQNNIRGDLAFESIIREIKGKKVITARLISLSTRDELFKTEIIAEEFPFEQRAPREQSLRRGEGGRQDSSANSNLIYSRKGMPGGGGQVRSFVFNEVSFRGVAVTDINKDGSNEVVVIGRNSLSAYQIGRGQLREVARFDLPVSNDFRWIDAADMNGNGIPEIYIANYRYGRLFSLVLEYRKGGFERLTPEKGIFFRLIRIRRPQDGSPIPDREAFLLLGQSQGIDLPLDGPIYRYRWSGKKLSAATPYTLPARLTILGFGLWDLDKDTSPEVVEVGTDDLVRVFSRRGEKLYQSGERYGGALFVFDHFFGQKTPDTEDGQIQIEGDGSSLVIRSRVLVEDVDGDRNEEALLIANQHGATRLVRGLGVSSGEIVGLAWDGGALSEIWRSRAVSGGVADFAFEDADNDGLKDLVIVSSGAEGFGGGERSNIHIYRGSQ